MDTGRLLGIGLAVTSIFAVTAVMQYAGRNSGRLGVALAQTAPDTGSIKSTWSIPVTGFRSASFSPDSAFFSLVGDPAGTVSLYRRNGKMVYRLPLPDATNAVVGPSGTSLLAFSAMDPTRQSITIVKGLKHEGVYKFPLDGAIWGATISGNGQYAAVVTGAHSLYIFTLNGYPKFERHPLIGTGNSVSISNDGSYLTSGTWDQSGVSCFTIKGAELWRYQDDNGKGKPVTNRLFEAQIAKNSPYILGVSYANVRQSNATVYLWHKTGRGRPMWTHPLDADDSEPQAKISADGTRVALVYVHKIMHGDQSIRVRQLILLDRFNNSLWPAPKGGPLMSPNLVAISPNGNTVTVTDGQRAIYNFDADGRISAAKMNMNALIHSTVTSDDGKYVLVYTEDGKLTLVQPA